VLRAYLADRTLTDAQREVIDAIRRCKRVRKAYGTFVKPLIVATGTDWGPFDETIDMSQWPPQKHAMANGRHEDPRLCVWPDGRLRVGWNAHVTTVGRLSCGGSPSRYNLQTVPASLRDMFVASPGHVFVGADLDQVHLRIIASRWHVPSLLADFAEGRDPHATFAATVFGDKFTSAKGQPCEANGWRFGGLAKALRNLGKTLRYTGAYGAGVPTIYRTMTRAEDENGHLLNRDLKLREVRIMHQEWMESEPEWALGWNAEMSSYDANGYLASPIMGRRCDFEDGDAKGDLKTKVSNYATLSGEADVMVPMTYELSQRVPWGYAGADTGLVGQFHDAMLVECPVDDAERVKTILEGAMNTTVPGWVVPITAGAEIGHRWSDV
jgi:DNA polymerase-1